MDVAALKQLVEQLTPEQLAAALPRLGLESTLGIHITYASPERVEAYLDATEALVQPYGLVHGGVYCALAESVCSVGAALVVLTTGQSAVGVENSTRFRRAVRPGHRIHVVATPGPVEGRDHPWHAEMHTERGPCASSKVVVRALPEGTALAGAALAIRES